MPSRETTRPVVSGDERHWPTTKSPILSHRPLHRSTFPRRHGRTSECSPSLTQGPQTASVRPHPSGRERYPYSYVRHTLPHTQPRTASHVLLGFRCCRNDNPNPRSRFSAPFWPAGGSETQPVGRYHWWCRESGHGRYPLARHCSP